MHRIERAIILAAGKGERLKPLTLEIPKPLLPINNKPMIEGLIESLINKGITEIYVVVGYLKEKFDYLISKYKTVTLIENPYYESFNNLSSLYVAREHLENVVIMDGDQIINNDNILNREFVKSSYCVKYTDEYTKEWLLEVNDNRVVSCNVNGGKNGYQLYSVSKWTKEDGLKLKDLLEIEFGNHNAKNYWDDIALNLYPDKFDLGIEIVKDEDIVEIDTINEYLIYIK